MRTETQLSLLMGGSIRANSSSWDNFYKVESLTAVLETWIWIRMWVRIRIDKISLKIIGVRQP